MLGGAAHLLGSGSTSCREGVKRSLLVMLAGPMLRQVGGNCIITGAVRVNDEHMPLAKLKKIMGFVPQDDTVHVDLTVR